MLLPQLSQSPMAITEFLSIPQGWYWPVMEECSWFFIYDSVFGDVSFPKMIGKIPSISLAAGL